jgi:hypothetical protein
VPAATCELTTLACRAQRSRQEIQCVWQKQRSLRTIMLRTTPETKTNEESTLLELNSAAKRRCKSAPECCQSTVINTQLVTFESRQRAHSMHARTSLTCDNVMTLFAEISARTRIPRSLVAHVQGCWKHSLNSCQRLHDSYCRRAEQATWTHHHTRHCKEFTAPRAEQTQAARLLAVLNVLGCSDPSTRC